MTGAVLYIVVALMVLDNTLSAELVLVINQLLCMAHTITKHTKFKSQEHGPICLQAFVVSVQHWFVVKLTNRSCILYNVIAFMVLDNTLSAELVLVINQLLCMGHTIT